MILLFKKTWFLMIFLIFSVTSFSIYFSGKRTPKWIQKATKMGPTITPKPDFWDFGAFWKKMFFQGFWKQKKLAPNPNKSGKKPARGHQDDKNSSAQRNARCQRRGKERLKTSRGEARFRSRIPILEFSVWNFRIWQKLWVWTFSLEF